MNRASPVELRKAISMAQAFVQGGIDFVAIPVLNDEDKATLVADLTRRLDAIEKESPWQ